METDNVIFLEGKNKICPVCGTVNTGKKIFYCSNTECNTWLPHLNTSWVRSATNLLLVKRILEIINEKNRETFSKNDLLDALLARKVIKVNLTRVDDPVYWQGSPTRRASEYLQIFKYLGIVKPSTSGKFSISELGKRILMAETRKDFTGLFTLVISHFDPSNEYVDSGYKELGANYFLLALDLIDSMAKISKDASIEHVGLAFLCRNREDYTNAKKMATECSSDELVQLIWGDSKELGRVVKGVFLRWLEQSKLIGIIRTPGHFKISLTEFGKKILDRYLDKIFKEDLTLGEISLFEKISDETNDEYVDKELNDINSLLVFSTEKEERYKLALNIKRSVVYRTGGQWEQYVFNHLFNLGLDPKWYRITQDFVNVRLPNSALNALRGGTRHNPDIVFYEPLFLVDPKGDAGLEMYKIQAYDAYATHEEVNGNALIVSKALMGQEQAERLKDLDKTNVIDKEALDLLVNNKSYLTKNSILKILGYGCEHGQYINEEVVLDKIDSLV